MNDESATSAGNMSQSRLDDRENKVTVHIRYKGVEETFAGSVESVWLSLSRFFNEFLPSFEVAQLLTLNVDLEKLARECEGIITFSREGPHLLVPRNEMTDSETLGLLLLAGYLGHELGMVETDSVSKDELQDRLGKASKITSARLGELVKNQIAARTPEEKYRITSFGIAQMQKDTLPRIKAKMST